MDEDDGVLIGPQLAANLEQLVSEWLAGKLSIPAGRTTTPVFADTPIYFTNDSGAIIPAYACMQVTGTLELGGQNYCKVKKPVDTDGTAGAFIVNGSAEVAIGDEGIAQNGPIVRVYKSTGTVTAGDKWTPTVAQWYMTADSAGLWAACGDDDIDTDVFKIFMPVGGGGCLKMAAKLTAAWSAGSASASEIYSMDGVTLTYVEAATVYDPLFVFSTLSTDDWLYVSKQAGKYYASDNASCTGTSPLIDTPPESGPP